MRLDSNSYGWSRIDHMNARRAAKPASGGKNYALKDRMVNKAAERERWAALNPLERMREEAYYRLGDAACNFGAPSVPAIRRAEEAIQANPGKSNRAIADEIGVSEPTVRRARQSGASYDAPEKRVGKDGKSYPVKLASEYPGDDIPF